MKTNSDVDKLVARYLSQLGRELSDLPASRRRQIVEEVSSHIAEGLAALDTEDEAGVRSVLDRVGDPSAIAAEGGAAEFRPRVPWADALVPWLLLLGGFVFVVGWFLGVGLLWSSSTWKVRDKLLGTLVIPGGLPGLVLLGTFSWRTSSTSCGGVSPLGQRAVIHCVTSGFSLPAAVGILVLILALLAPFAVAVHLERVRRRSVNNVHG